ncbi:hypothetical protein [uncultured Brevundimonas sp.]|uniref:hypothetical protein n=1 Tax=uncultured Brevundimonas sp. TaxID=213418 RepID=UPI0025FCC269|nr:hypothetical protein [uncultured Brevundimonas sp.]
MGCLDCSATVLKLQQVDDAEDTADIIDEAVARALVQVPNSAKECVALIDLVIQGLVVEQRARADSADITGLRAVRAFVAKTGDE